MKKKPRSGYRHLWRCYTRSKLYYPIQIPYLISEEFSDSVRYTEHVVESLQKFVICFWEMHSLSDKAKTVENIIVTDGCIDLVADVNKKQIGFAGMSKTDFHFLMELPGQSMGARFMPGAFYQLTGLCASSAMDDYLPLEKVDGSFDQHAFFSMPLEQARTAFYSYVCRIISGMMPDRFTSLFTVLAADPPETTSELCKMMNYSSRQCQRLFQKHFGITPKMALSIIRFQKCLEILTSGKASPSDVLEAAHYYDQPHFNNDFKRNLGITPLELIARYKKH